jgi:pyruvate/2-oxoglutarate dehydrogenase complex dihydrolipoamide acyltransferase (E2) component
MSTRRRGFHVVPFSGPRRVIVGYLDAASRKHLVHALVEVDVTVPRRIVREHRERTGASLSFTAFVVACVARAVAENPLVHAYRLGRGRLVVFDRVDVCALVEHGAGDDRIAAPYVFRDADVRTYRELHDELRRVQAGGAPSHRQMRAGGALPRFLGRWLWRALGRRPFLWRRLAGTVSVTSVGMFGEGAGWGIPISEYTLMLTVGGIARKPGFGPGGRVESREYLSLTVSVDHDVVDGAPAARFIRRLEELIQAGHGLAEFGRTGDGEPVEARARRVRGGTPGPTL